jgi:hypothetical protein
MTARFGQSHHQQQSQGLKLFTFWTARPKPSPDTCDVYVEFCRQFQSETPGS